MQLGRATSKACEEIRRLGSESYDLTNWDKLAQFFFLWAFNDAKTASKLATESESWNKMVKCHILLVQARFELAVHLYQTATDERVISNPGEKAKLVNIYGQGIEQLKELQVSVPQKYMKKWGPNECATKRAWVQAYFVQPLNLLLESWEALKRSTKGETMYQRSTSDGVLVILNDMTQTGKISKFSNPSSPRSN